LDALRKDLPKVRGELLAVVEAFGPQLAFELGRQRDGGGHDRARDGAPPGLVHTHDALAAFASCPALGPPELVTELDPTEGELIGPAASMSSLAHGHQPFKPIAPTASDVMEAPVHCMRRRTSG
jgi:hypothetical protein